MGNPSVSEILEQFDAQRFLYDDFCGRIRDLVEELLLENGIRLHSVSSRVKQRESLAKKLTREGKTYSGLNDVTDLAGVRITTYFADDVDRVAEIIEGEFEVDRANSTDKRAVLDPDRFGYLSLHHVVSLSQGRSTLTEYRRFPALKVEIQTRSILQHAWAEIEHDLGYKTSLAVPTGIRRRFSRLAGLLELADQEFVGIRDELSSYETSVAERIQENPQAVQIDAASLRAFTQSNPLVRELNHYIAITAAGSRLDEEASDFMEDKVAYFVDLGLSSIDEIETAIQDRQALIKEFARAWLAHSGGVSADGYFSRGITLFYLAYILAAERLNDEELFENLRRRRTGRSDAEVRKWAANVRAIFQQARAAITGSLSR